MINTHEFPCMDKTFAAQWRVLLYLFLSPGIFHIFLSSLAASQEVRILLRNFFL